MTSWENDWHNANAPCVPIDVHIPPVLGEYAYYHAKFSKLEDKKKCSDWLVRTNQSNVKFYGCHYSLPYESKANFVTCHGIIEVVESVNAKETHFDCKIKMLQELVNTVNAI